MSEEEATAHRRTVTLRRSVMSEVLEVEGDIESLLGYQAEELIGVETRELIHPDDHDVAVSAWVAMLIGGTGDGQFRGRYRHKDGRWVWMDTVSQNELENPEMECVISTVRETDAEQISVYEELRTQQEILARLTELLPVGILQIESSGRVIDSNQQLTRMTGVENPQALGDLIAMLDSAIEDEVMSTIERTLAGEILVGRETRFENGRNCLMSLRYLTDATGLVNGALIVFSDITEQINERDEFRSVASIDPLTGCLSRWATFQRVEALLAAERRVSVAFVDLDKFKTINDTYGHQAGDAALEEAARRIRDVSRASDVCGRIGGDEFMVVLAGENPERGAELLSARIEPAFSVPFEFEGHMLELGASVGIAHSSGHDDPSLEVLIEEADAAMYAVKAKRQGV